ncbi:proline oxidase PrnD [Paecilomyces variotii]|uniref:Proline dehydrogenase n=1 Tax=Byssochlamys spectabilis TaxID=264951 RepID=A0A443HSH4_BYSSP|nr:proline oxidase PrnD [Paecilomyces variotii]KAJ9356773.1 hypothetical protein DTO280E4_5964 [Paecilomyces variotii]RWQ94765.1 proline oxidase PrnD [Paecilomyces variotii]
MNRPPRPLRTLRVKSSTYPRPRRVSNTGTSRSPVVSTPSTASINNCLQPSSEKRTTESPLAVLPLSTVLRSLLILSISSSPILLKPCIRALSALAHPKTPVLDVAKNPALNWIIKNTIYKQFNAGENKVEVQRSIQEMKSLGYRGVLLGYAREVLAGENGGNLVDEKAAREEVDTWLQGTLQTVDMAQEGDFVALKFTGMGNQALSLLRQKLPPSEYMDEAIRSVCDSAIARGARLLVDAEEQAVQPGIEEWIMTYQKYINLKTPGRATLYGTYQAYLRSTPATIARHLEIARQEGYTLGVKLVRGAYLKTEPRHLIWAEKEETDRCYDGIVEALLARRYNDVLKPASDEHTVKLPPVNVIIATHNQDSVRKAHSIRLQQAARSEPRVELAYAQLQGMADEVSCELLQGFQSAEAGTTVATTESPNVYKLLTWGSVKECMGFLFRRAVENTEAVGRTKQSQLAMAQELQRRARKALGF